MSKTKQIILLGEGKNQHTLYGKFNTNDNHGAHCAIDVLAETKLQHETPDGAFAEHKGLMLDKGKWVQGQQVEYNPFTRSISDVWD